MIGFRQRVGMIFYVDITMDATDDTPVQERTLAALQEARVHAGELMWIPKLESMRPMGPPNPVAPNPHRGQEALTTEPESLANVEIPPEGLDVSHLLGDEPEIPPDGLDLNDDSPPIPLDGLTVPDSEIEQESEVEGGEEETEDEDGDEAEVEPA